jgi:hypothetical protein
MIHSQKLLSLPEIFPVEVGPTSDSSIPNQGASGTSMQVRNLRFETEVGVTCAPKRVSLVTNDGSSLVTNAGRQKPPQRHQLDYTIQWLELRSVDFTAAAEDKFFLRAGDATAVT